MRNSPLKALELKQLVAIADSGTWGDEGTPADGSPVLRSTNIHENRIDLQDPAWRIIPKNDRERRRLHAGDIIVTKSSGSPDHIGKCAVFQQPHDGRDYYFSNFMLRLRAEPTILDHRWLYYWLTSNRGRSALQGLNSTTTGLRNLNVGQYLSQEIPLPYPDDPARSVPEQKRIADILDKADAIRRKRWEALDASAQLERSTFRSMHGDPNSNPHRWPVERLGNVITFVGGSQPPKETFISEPRDGYVRLVQIRDFKSDRFPTYIPAGLAKRHFAKDDVMIARYGPPVFQILRGLEGSYNVALMKADCTARTTKDFIYHLLQIPEIHDVVVAHSDRTAGQSGVNLTLLSNMVIPIPPITTQTDIAKTLAQIKRVSIQMQSHSDEAEDLFNTLVQRAFKDEL